MLKPEDKALFERVVPGNTSHINFMDIRIGHEDLGELLDLARAEGAAGLREALLSDEAVEAGARAAEPWAWGVTANIMHTEVAAVEREKASNKARAALSAALDKIGAPNIAR